MKEKILKAPKIVTVIVAVIVIAVFFGASDLAVLLMTKAGMPELSGYGSTMVAEFISGLIAFLLLLLFGYRSILREKGKGFLAGLYIGGFLTGYCCLELVAQLYVQILDGNTQIVSAVNILYFVITMFLIGWTEELVFRGLVLNLFLDRFSKTKKGILSAVVLSGVMFGAVHLTNAFHGISLQSAAVQAVNAALLGVIFGAVYARSRNIWLVIMFHAMVDFAGLLGSGLFGNGSTADQINQMSAVNLVAVPVLLIPCIILLRPGKLAELEMEANQIVVFATLKEAEKDAFVSLILGALSFMFCFSGYGIGLAIVGIIAGMQSRKTKPEQNGVALAGMILSVVGLVIGIIGAVGFSILLQNQFFRDILF